MANILMNKVLNGRVDVNNVLKWLCDPSNENTYIDHSCSQKEFITHFLNTLHCLSTRHQIYESPAKITEPKVDNSSVNFTNRNLSNGSHGKNSLNISQNSSRFSQNSFNSTCTTSTPMKRSFNTSSFEKNYSPIHHSCNSGKSATLSEGKICLGDFLVTNKKSSSKKQNGSMNEMEQKKKLKKFKPINLSESRFTTGRNENSFNFMNQVEAVSSNEVNKDFRMGISAFTNKLKARETSPLPRQLVDLNINKPHQLKPNNLSFKNDFEKIEGILSDNTEISAFNNNSMTRESSLISKEIADSNSNKQNNFKHMYLRYKKEIEKIIVIYEFLLKNGFVLSLLSELYFVINLLNSKFSCDMKDSDLNNVSDKNVTFDVVFGNVDEIVFLASSVLEKMFYLLRFLDKITLRYLCDNKRLKISSPEFLKKLEKIYEEKEENNPSLYNLKLQNNVCFVVETDNQNNFPSEGSFQGFKKQRDIFYDILRSWEEDHKLPNFDFEVALGRKVRNLVSYHKDSVNFMRLSKLFMEQLLNACSKQVRTQSTDALSSLTNVDKDKIVRLKNRLTNKPSNGLNKVPDFCGYQEFFRDFIIASDNPIFIKHLCDIFISKIMELNETTFDTLDVLPDEEELEFDTKKAFVSCLTSLKTLAKFLGFIEAMPYKNATNHSVELMALQVNIRNRVNPIFDIKSLLEKSIATGCLTLFVPWFCEYLSMLDAVTLRTSYYINLIESMMNLYRCLVRNISLLPFYNSLLVIFSFGWFFELNDFPHYIFFEKLNYNNEMKSIFRKTIGFDKLTIVDGNILYILCPFLETFRKLLSNETSVKDRASRHITPLTTVEPVKNMFKKKMEVQIEEAFFNNHPSSLKKTVEFIAERVASVCVKHLCHNVVPNYKKSFVSLLRSNLKQWSSEEGMKETGWKGRGEKFAEDKMEELKTICDKEVTNIVQSRIRISLVALLPTDTLPHIENICVAAAERMCREKVQQWASTHIVMGLLVKEVKVEMKALYDLHNNGGKTKASYTLPPCGNSLEHEINTESGAHILHRIRTISASLITKPDLQEETLIESLNEIIGSITQRNDLNGAVIKMLGLQLVDLMLLLVCKQPSTIMRCKEEFLKVWKLSGDKAIDLFEDLISVKNFVIIVKKGAGRQSLHAKAVVCTAIIKENVLSPENFESQCIGLFKDELENDILKAVSLFFHDFVEIYENQCCSSKFTYLLEFLSDYCSDL